MLCLICVSALVGLLVYLSRRTRRAHFRLWTASFILYAAYLAISVASEAVGTKPFERTVLAWTMGLSALLMLWADFQLAERPRPDRELALAALLVAAWGYGEFLFVGDLFWLMAPLYWMHGAARIWAGILLLRSSERNRGTRLLISALLLWGLQALVCPLVQRWSIGLAAGHLSSSILILAIAIGIMVEEEWKASDEKYRGVLESSPAAVFLVDLWSVQILDLNTAAQRLTRRSREDLLGSEFLDLCPDLRKAGDNQLDHRAMFNAVFKPYNEFHVMRSDGAVILCEGETHLVQWQQRAVLQVGIREVNQDKKIGQLVRRAEKLSSLGQLIAGVAHELNNPLAIVVAYAQIMAKHKGIDENVRGSILKVLHESERAAKIVRDLLTFARPCEPQMEVVDVNRLVANVLEVREADFRANHIAVARRFAPALPNTKADPIQMEQVLTNLVTNAVHALAGQDGPRTLAVVTEESGFFIGITVMDNGPGIPHEIQGRIFEPFFTTKSPGKGTGLGLSISRTIIQEHRGKIWLRSGCGKGAAFHIELPVVPCETEVARRMAPGGDAAVEKAVSDRRLLIVDDEPGIREVLKEVLGATGYRVETACTGREAISQIASTHFDLIISDLCMPEMDGEKLYRTVREMNPELARRMIFVTGDTVRPQSRIFLEETGNRWLSKPFNISDVEEAVQTLLNQDPLNLLTGQGSHPATAGRPVGKYHPGSS